MSIFGKANPSSHPHLPSSPPPLNASPVKLKSTGGPLPIATEISNDNNNNNNDNNNGDAAVDVYRTMRNDIIHDSQSSSLNTSSSTAYLKSINYHRSSKKDRSMNFDRSVNSSDNSRGALSSTTRTTTTTTYPSSTASSDATSTATIKKDSSSSSSSRGTSLFKKTAAAGLQYFNRPTKSKATERGGGLEEDFDHHLTVVQQLRDMGYSEKEVVVALNASGHNLEAALTMLNEDKGTVLDRTDGVDP
jgi:hypothetical protein